VLLLGFVVGRGRAGATSSTRRLRLPGTTEHRILTLGESSLSFSSRSAEKPFPRSIADILFACLDFLSSFQCKQCHDLLENIATRRPIEVLVGKKNLEVRPLAINKGEIVKSLLYKNPDADFVFCAGDDKTDEGQSLNLPIISRPRRRIVDPVSFASLVTTQTCSAPSDLSSLSPPPPPLPRPCPHQSLSPPSSSRKRLPSLRTSRSRSTRTPSSRPPSARPRKRRSRGGTSSSRRRSSTRWRRC
jgi:hypothetical protein